MDRLRYHPGLRILHWLMALIILGLIASGWYMTGIPREAPDKFLLYPWHKSFGMLVLALAAIRLILRSATAIPPLPQTMRWIERRAAHLTHYTLYAFMLAMPLTGYVMSMAGGHGVKFFGIALPNLIGEDKALAALVRQLHTYFAYAMLAIIALHILGAVKHRFFDKPEHDVLGRM